MPDQLERPVKTASISTISSMLQLLLVEKVNQPKQSGTGILRNTGLEKILLLRQSQFYEKENAYCGDKR